jgi:uncharacterized membrane protein YbhN (UPF0104 family)
VTHDRTRQVLIAVLGIAATAVAVALIGQAAHFPELLKRLRGAIPGWLVVCAVGETLAYVGFMAAYQVMAGLAGGPWLPPKVLVRVVGLSFGAYSLATTVGGLSVDFWALREAGEPPEQASARVIALETMRWAVLGVATCLAGIAVLLGLTHRVPWPVPVAWLVIVPACFAGGIWISAPGRRDRFTRAADGWIRRALGVAVRALVYVRRLMSGPRRIRWRALTGAAVFWAGDIVCAWAALRAFGTTVQVAPLILGYSTGYVSVGLPLPGGGAGGVDAAMTGGFVLAGAPLSSALLGAVAFRLFTFWLPTLAALLAVVTAHGLRDRLHEIATERPSVAGPRARARGSASRRPLG